MAASSLTVYLILFIFGIISIVSGQGGGISHSTTSTLFNNERYIVELHDNNFTNTVSNSETAWAVVFYASWCGGCQRFAPKWSAFSHDVKDWSGVVRIASLACSHPDNTDICKTYAATSYPTIRFFPPYHLSEGPRAIGEKYAGVESGQSIRRKLVDFLENVPRVPATWPRLQPVRTIRDIHATDEQQSVLFVDEAEGHSMNPYISREIALDLSKYHDRLLVNRMASTDAENYAIRQIPSLHQVNSDGSLIQIAGELDRRGYRDLLLTNTLQISPENIDVEQNSITTTTIQPIVSHSIHSQDLESFIYYTLFHQVPTLEAIEGNNLDTIKTHVDMITKLLPLQDGPTLAWLELFNAWLQQQHTSISSEEWLESVSGLQTEAQHIPERVVWMGCLGTVSRYRGFPCSLWTVFHTLTVAADAHPDRGFTGKEVLLNMRSYIATYFLCDECRNNFALEAADVDSDVTDDRSAVMWLWRTHNRVNSRLHGDPTEDPGYPKKQFPDAMVCPSCYQNLNSEISTIYDYNSVQWSESDVYSYLHGFYGDEAVVYDAHPYTFVESERIADEPESEPDSNVATMVHPETLEAMLLIFSALYFTAAVL